VTSAARKREANNLGLAIENGKKGGTRLDLEAGELDTLERGARSSDNALAAGAAHGRGTNGKLGRAHAKLLEELLMDRRHRWASSICNVRLGRRFWQQSRRSGQMAIAHGKGHGTEGDQPPTARYDAPEEEAQPL
jgi:hypothetical protein